MLVTARNTSSVSIAFDDFKPPNYNLGYAVKYRPIADDGFVGNRSWTISPMNSSRPFFVLNALLPNTQYQIQVFTWEKVGGETRSHSEVINASTLDGCVHENGTFAVGDKVLADCDQTCICQSGGSLACTER